MDTVLTLTQGQFNLVYNSFSLVIAGMGAALLFFVLQRHQVSPANRLAVTISTLVVGIALYHYVRIFDSWNHAFSFVDGEYVSTGPGFNEGYRYVDWLLTVPLLLAELVGTNQMRVSRDLSRACARLLEVLGDGLAPGHP